MLGGAAERLEVGKEQKARTTADTTQEQRARAATEKSSKNPRRNGLILAGIIAFSVIVGINAGRDDDTTEQTQPPPAAFQVISRNDISNKALEGPLSSYTAAEIAALPTAKRETVNAIIDGPITQDQVEPTLHAILDVIRAADSDTDEITIWLHSDADRIGRGWDIGRLLWAPHGEMGRITPQIASSNDRSTYQVVVEIRSDVESYLAGRMESTEQHGMSTEARRAYWQALWDLEGDLYDTVDAQIDPLVDFQGNAELYNRLLAEGRARLQQEHGVTPEAHLAILQEGLEKGW